MHDLIRYDMSSEARREYQAEYSTYLDEMERIRDEEEKRNGNGRIASTDAISDLSGQTQEPR